MNGILRHAFAAVSTLVFLLGSNEASAESADVLLLGDDQSESQVAWALESAGHHIVYGGLYYEWDGITPDVNDFDVVIYLDGYDYGYGLLPAADAAISTFVAAAGGFVITE